jgi:16S rRNA (guanine527-N7)-methyltransferase
VKRNQGLDQVGVFHVKQPPPGRLKSRSEGLSDRYEHALERLSDRYGLSACQRKQLRTILETLAQQAHAPTAVRDIGSAIDVHLADSLVALELEPVRAAHTVADLGSGAGFPGLPLAVALPDNDFRLIDSQQRRCRFIDSLTEAANIPNARAVWTRAEEWSAGHEANDLVLARALGPAPTVLEYAAPLLRPGGVLIEWRGHRDATSDANAQQAGETLGLERQQIQRVEPFTGAAGHHLHLYLKVRDTPTRFPRRPGVARKRPLGASDRDRR